MELNRPLQCLGGLCGAAGLAAYASATHGTSANLNVVAPILLIHAPAFLVLAILSAQNRATLIGGWIITLGLMLFIGDLLSRDFAGDRLFPFAAPTGGSLLILGWLVVGLSAFATKTRPSA